MVRATIPADLSPEQERAEQFNRGHAAECERDRCTRIARRELAAVVNLRHDTMHRSEVEGLLRRIVRDIHSGAFVAEAE